MYGSNTWEHIFTHSIDPFNGYVTSYTDALEIINIFEGETNSKFVVRGVKHQGIGSETGSSVGANHFIRFEDVKKQNSKLPFAIECDNVPFICKNIQNFACHRGKKYEKQKHSKTVDHDYQNVSKKAIQNSKKQGCEAQIILREIVRFPEFKIPKNTEAMRKKSSKQLRAALSDIPNAVVKENRYYICLPKNGEHNHDNNFTEDYVQELDERLKKRIYQLVGDSVDSTTEIKRYLKEFVNSNKVVWFQNGTFPSQSNKRFYPNNQTIRNHINLALKQYSVFHILDETILPPVYENVLNESYLDPGIEISAENIPSETHLGPEISTESIPRERKVSQDLGQGMEVSADIALQDNNHSSKDKTGKNLSRSVSECRTLLEELTNLTYNITDQNVADNLNKTLKELLITTSLKTSGNSLPLEVKKTNTTSIKRKYSELPKRKKRKLIAKKK